MTNREKNTNETDKATQLENSQNNTSEKTDTTTLVKN